jgi:bifunctional oligoribonuclease and PAP phosphatase NrnA
MTFTEKFGDQLLDLKKNIEASQKILLISHKKPDGDTMGSAVAMAEMLQKMEKTPVLFCVDSIPDAFQFLQKAGEYQSNFSLDDFDMAMMFDAGGYTMAGIHEQYPNIFGGKFPLANIDHHISNEQYGRWNIVDIDSASTTVVLSKMFRAFGWKIFPKAATPLLLGLYTDTGSLMHANSTPDAHREAARILAAGADLRSIVQYIFRTKSVETLRLWGRVLSRISQDSQGVTISYVKDRDFLETKGNVDVLTGVVDYLNAVPKAKFSLLFTEYEGKVKGSLRTLSEEVDLTEIAGQFGGGGHKKASGFTVTGTLKLETRWKITSKNPDIPETLRIPH